MPNRTTQPWRVANGVVHPGANNTQRPAANANPRIRWAEPVASFIPSPTHAVSDPIWIPGAQPIEQPSSYLQYNRQFLHQIFDTEPRIHHRLDNVTDYGRSGTHGWEFAQRARVEREEANVGEILAGEWPPRIPWEKQRLVRKDPDFSKDEKPAEPTQQEMEDDVRLKMMKWKIAKQLRKLQEAEYEDE
jgi:hypothetical protein